MSFQTQYGPWALVCGASEGIGECFARQLAEAGINVVLLARRGTVINRLAEELSSEFGVMTRALAVDLTAPELMQRVRATTEDLEVGLLIYVTGSPGGFPRFLDQSPEEALSLVRLNCDAPVRLAHHFGQGMRERGRGGMMFLTSLSALSGASRQSLYAPTKAFDQMFAESLWHELAPHGVDVISLMVGATRTPKALRDLGIDFSLLSPDGKTDIAMDAAEVAREGLENLAHGPLWVVGEMNRAAFGKFPFTDRAAAVEGASWACATINGLEHVPVRRP